MKTKATLVSLRYAALAAACVLAFAAYSQGQGQPDFSKVEIKTTKLADNFYTLEGQGGTIGVLTGTYSSIYVAAPILLWLVGKHKVTAEHPHYEGPKD